MLWMRGAFILLTVLVVGGSLLALRQWQEATTYSGPGADVEPQVVFIPPRLAVMGDSYSGGSPGIGGVGDDGWPALVAADLGWELNLEAEGGTGYVSGAERNISFPDRVDALTRFINTPIIIIEGSRLDTSSPTDEVVRRARETWGSVRRDSPKSKILIIGPIWSDLLLPAGQPEATLGALEKAARQDGLAFINPQERGWFVGPGNRMIGSDKVHPTNKGHKFIARQVMTEIENRGWDSLGRNVTQTLR